MLFWMALSIKPRPKPSRSSISKFRPHYRESIRISLILATRTAMPANGKLKQKTCLNVSSRTSKSSKGTRPERLWLPLGRNYNFRIRTTKKGTSQGVLFLLPFPGSPPAEKIYIKVLSGNRSLQKTRTPKVVITTFGVPASLRILSYPMYPFIMPRLLLRTNMMISSRSFEAGISASILSTASELFKPDWKRIRNIS